MATCLCNIGIWESEINIYQMVKVLDNKNLYKLVIYSLKCFKKNNHKICSSGDTNSQ